VLRGDNGRWCCGNSDWAGDGFRYLKKKKEVRLEVSEKAVRCFKTRRNRLLEIDAGLARGEVKREGLRGGVSFYRRERTN